MGRSGIKLNLSRKDTKEKSSVTRVEFILLSFRQMEMKASDEAKKILRSKVNLSMVGAVIACPLRVETPRQNVD